MKVIDKRDFKRPSWPASMHNDHRNGPAHMHAGFSRAVGAGALLTTTTAVSWKHDIVGTFEKVTVRMFVPEGCAQRYRNYRHGTACWCAEGELR